MLKTVLAADRALSPPRRLGERVLAAGIVTDLQLKQALEVQTRTGAFIGQVLVDLGYMSAATVGSMLAQQFGVPYVDLVNDLPDAEAISRVPEDLIRSARVMPIRLVDEGALEVAMVDPLDVAAIDRLNLATGLRIMPCLTMMTELQRAINEHFDAGARTSIALQELEAETGARARATMTRGELAAASEAPIVRLVNAIVENALSLHASDIHFEPREREMRIRFRIDGVMLEQSEIPRTQMIGVLARLKVLCQMDITETRRPQDGRMLYDFHGRAFDIRVSSVPTVYGEKLVLRVLDKSSVLVPLTRLGFLPDQQKTFESMIRQPHGMLMVVGPTGSGKSTTLYASLNLLNDATRNIMTLEDPVEYNVPGLNQIQVNPRIGLTFASGLRSFVRQDPDVILVGEIRDHETAEMAVQASLTGHLLLTTLHANSAVGTIARLVNLGVDPFLIAQALTGVVSQRLVARVCSNCAVDYQPAPEVLEAIRLGPKEAAAIRFKRGRGCRNCHQRGYSGRIGVFEIIEITEDLRRLMMRRASTEELQAEAIRGGMRSLRESVLVAVRAGTATPEEMGRVVLTKEV